MKRIIVMALLAFSALFVFVSNATAQKRTKIGNGVTLISYGNTAVIEDEKNQRSISITISQEINSRQTNEKIYKVACGKWTKRVVKDGLRLAIIEGIKYAGATGGTSAIVSAASTAALYVYDDVCEYFKD